MAETTISCLSCRTESDLERLPWTYSGVAAYGPDAASMDYLYAQRCPGCGAELRGEWRSVEPDEEIAARKLKLGWKLA